MKREWLEVWRGLPRWMRRDMLRGCREYWIYSGMEEIGWSFSIGGGGMGEGGGEGEEGEIVITSPYSIMEWLRGLVGGGEFWSFCSEGKIYLGMRFGEEEWMGEGLDRELALYSLLRVVGVWYWEEKRPCFGDISKSNIVMSGEYEGEIEVEIRENGEGMELYFEDFWIARMFMGRWNKFAEESEDGNGGMVGSYYHGKMLMVEGEVLVVSGQASRMNSGMGYQIGYGNSYVSPAVGNLGGYNPFLGGGGIKLNNIMGEDLTIKLDEIIGSECGDKMN